jgi:hypothetical protein
MSNELKPSAGIHWPSLGLFALSGLGLLGFLTSLATLPVIAIFGMNSGGLDSFTAYSLVSLAWTSGLMLLLLVPGMLIALFRLMGKALPVWKLPPAERLAWVAVAVWPVFVFLGWLVSRNDRLSLYFLPIIQLAVIGIPLVWLVVMGSRGLKGGSQLRRWGLVNFGMLASQPFILIIETIVLVGLLIAWVVWLASNPDMLTQMQRIAQRLVNAQMDQEVLTRILRPYLQQPGLIFAVIGIIAGLVPLMEELLKPLGLWLVAGRLLTPEEGFFGGLISGAVFGLMESLGALATPTGSDWIVTAIGRVGTGILHTVISGVVGWGLATAFTQGRYLKLVAAYLGAVMVHSIWNLFGISMGIAQLYQTGSQSGVATVITFLSQIAPFALAAIAVGLVLFLLVFNRSLRAAHPTSEMEV